MTILPVILGFAAGLPAGWFAFSRFARTGDPIRKHPRGMEEKDPYRLCETVLTTPEAAFHKVLREAMPQGSELLVKVRLGDILSVSYGAADRGEAHARVGNKRLDFVVCNAAMTPQLAVLLGEPDDVRTREFIVRVCAKAGLPLVCLPAQQTYRDAEVKAWLTEHWPVEA